MQTLSLITTIVSNIEVFVEGVSCMFGTAQQRNLLVSHPSSYPLVHQTHTEINAFTPLCCSDFGHRSHQGDVQAGDGAHPAVQLHAAQLGQGGFGLLYLGGVCHMTGVLHKTNRVFLHIILAHSRLVLFFPPLRH